MVEKFSTLADAIALAEFAHRSQKDKAGMDYIDHPLRVMRTVQDQGAQPYIQMAAVLHDVTEDTRFTTDMLQALGFSESVVNVVRLVDRHASAKVFHKQNEGRDLAAGLNDSKRRFYISLGPDAEDEFYYTQIRKHPGALMVKRADIADNTLPHRLSHFSQETQDRLTKKYKKALDILNG